MTPFPKYTEDNCMVIFSGIRDTSYRKFHLDQSTKLFFMCLELGLNKNPPAGLKIILDFKGVNIYLKFSVLLILVWYTYFKVWTYLV